MSFSSQFEMFFLCIFSSLRSSDSMWAPNTPHSVLCHYACFLYILSSYIINISMQFVLKNESSPVSKPSFHKYNLRAISMACTWSPYTVVCGGPSTVYLCLYCWLPLGSLGEFVKSAYVTSFLSLSFVVMDLKETI